METRWGPTRKSVFSFWHGTHVLLLAVTKCLREQVRQVLIHPHSVARPEISPLLGVVSNGDPDVTH